MARRPKRPASTPKSLSHQSQPPAPKSAKPARARRPKKQSQTQPLFLTVEEAAARLRVSTKTIRRWIDSGELPAVRVGSPSALTILPHRRNVVKCRSLFRENNVHGRTVASAGGYEPIHRTS
jgi:excisionase family DNA binding protein